MRLEVRVLVEDELTGDHMEIVKRDEASVAQDEVLVRLSDAAVVEAIAALRAGLRAQEDDERATVDPADVVERLVDGALKDLRPE